MKLGTIVSRLLFGLSVLSGCTAGQAGREESAPASKVAQDDLEGTPAARAESPLTLTVERIGTGTTVVLRAVVNVPGRTPAPVVLLAIPGEGTFLESGTEKEELGLLQPGSTMERTFQISRTAPTLEIRAISQAQASAATAVAFWPAEARPELERPNTTPIPPVKIGGVVIREAVPLNPDGAPEGGGADRGQ